MAIDVDTDTLREHAKSVDFLADDLQRCSSATGTTRLTFSWNPTPNAKSYRVTLTGPGPENGRTNVVPVPQAVYSGLESGHTYSVKVVPLNAAGIAGPAGTIVGVTGR